MRRRPTERQQISAHLSIWAAYDPAVKADLFSTAITTDPATVLVDPIPIHEPDLNPPLQAIIVTNQNHWRASVELADRLDVEIFAHAAAQLPDQRREFVKVSDGQRIAESLRVITIEGAAPGEIALFSTADGGSLVVGDALINFEPYGFTFLPAKYCTDHREMKKSLRRLIDLKIERILFAHGLPILSNAAARLRALIDGG